MAGFIYKNKSTETILPSSRLILATDGVLDNVIGSDREVISGESTLSRPIANEYGMKNNALTFEYSLIKEDGSVFTESEQITIERWLSSPKFSSSLNIIDCDGNIVCTYCGKFQSTEWIVSSGGFVGVAFSFVNNDAYPKKHFEHTFNITGNGVVTVDCQSDELEEYVYPKIVITEKVDEKSTATLCFITDNNNEFTVNTLEGLNINIDSLHCIVNDGTLSGIISFKDLGWSDVGNIYWPRLIPGENKIFVTGNVDITISYNAPYKKVGGWLS